MLLKNLTLLNYKNISQAEITPSRKINCLIGSNGEGKTNFLDAVYYLSFTKSAFSNVDTQIMRHEANMMMLEGQYLSDFGTRETVSMGIKRGQKKHFGRNKKEYKRLSEHIGKVPLIMVSPKDMWLIEGTSEERRRLMDVVIAQYDNTYIESLNRYNKALQQRNAILKSEEPIDSTLITLFEEQMADYGERVYRLRESLVEQLTPLFEHFYSIISEDNEKVSLTYTSHCQRGSLLEVIQRDRAKDIAVGYSLHGIHRDDLEMLLSDFPIKKEGSQGQNKTFVIALKLAQFDLLKRSCNGETPILLLDDVFDKLDAKRVEKIIKIVSGGDFGQIFLTDTNRDHLDRILQSTTECYKIFSVNQGNIKEEEQRDV